MLHLLLVPSLLGAFQPPVSPAPPCLALGSAARVSAEAEGAPSAAQDGGAPAEPKEPEWTGSINLGFTTTSGNTDVTTLSFDVKAKRESERDRTTLKAFYVFNEEDGDVTQRKTGASGQYDYFITKRTFVLGQASAETDEQRELDLRYTLGAGLGRKFIDGEKTKLDLEAGLTFVSEMFEDSANDAEFLSLRLASRYSYKFNENVRFESDTEVLPSLEDSRDLVAKSDNRLIVALAKNLSAQFQAVFDYDRSPAAGRDELDGRYVMSVGYSF